MSDYKSEFLQEAKEYVELMNQNFLRLEKGDKSAIDEIFRAMHTLKGMAGFMGYKNLENLCHRLESFLGSFKGKEITEEIVDLLLLSSDRISEMLNKIEVEDNDVISCQDIYEKIDLTEIENNKAKFKSKENNQDLEGANLKIEIRISDSCSMKGVRGFLILESLKEVCEIKATDPMENIIEEGCNSFIVFAKGDKKNVDEVLSGIAEIEKYTIDELEIIKRDKQEDQKLEEKINQTLQTQKKSDYVRVDVKVLDSIMNLIGELVIIKGRLLQISNKYEITELSETINIMEKSITSLQDQVMKVRMVKVERIFSKFPRMVRDLAKRFGKKIEFIMEGLETELDRTVLDEMSDPIMHLIRNAVDHGIESPEERKSKGKSEIGLIKLSARREKNNVVIEIEDDGKGIDLDKVRKKAIEKGIISESSQLSEEDLKMLIFLPGFSTKDQATEISGRGVGMDIVKTTVEKLGGSLKIISEKDKGTKIRINLPPTVAIIKSLLVGVSDQVYAIPISNVVEAVYVDNKNMKSIHGNPFLIVRENLIPCFKLSEIFGCENGQEREIGIIVEKEGEKYALLVDTIIDQQEVVVKPLTGFLSKIKGFSGVTILGDGTVVPIIDVSSLLGGDKFG